jgi:hypothetical protein
MKCIHFTGPGFYCKAFPVDEQRTTEEVKLRQAMGITLDPKGIPDEILLGENDHSSPFPTQTNDIVFELDPLDDGGEYVMEDEDNEDLAKELGINLEEDDGEDDTDEYIDEE